MVRKQKLVSVKHEILRENGIGNAINQIKPRFRIAKIRIKAGFVAKRPK